MAASRQRRRAAAALLAIAALLGAGSPGGARAGVSAQGEGAYSNGTSTTRDETGLGTRAETEQWTQRYRLGFDNQLYPLLQLSAGGDLRWDISSSTPGAGPRAESDGRTWNTYARLTAGDRILNGGLDYGRRWEEGETRQGGITTETPGIVRETASAAFTWRPADLPALSLRLSRSDAHDDTREQFDRTGEEALFSATYQPTADLDLRYALRYARSTDQLTDVVSNEIVNSAAVTWSGRYLGDRGKVYAGYNIAARTADTEAASGQLVEVRQLPIAGLSIVEQFPATPLRVKLNPNAALTDGNTEASAGVNLGTAAGTGPLIPLRDLGAEFRDEVTPVNAIHVYIDQDQTLPEALAGTFQWRAYQSRDNETWTDVGPLDPVVYNPVMFRFEIPIPRTQARYLKVVTAPLPEAATTDPRFREIFVTDLQFFEMVPAEVARGRSSAVAGSLSVTTRLVLVRGLGLAYDFSGSMAHADERRPTWSIVNGLSLARRLDPTYAVSARVERYDSYAGRAREAMNRWSASLSAEPLPTFGALLSYSGQISELEGGIALSNSGTLSVRAALYEGIALSGTASSSWAESETGVNSRSVLASVNASVVPNPILSLSGGVSVTESAQSGGGLPDRSQRSGVLEGNASVSPFPALSFAGGVTRQFGGAGPAVTLWSLNGAFSPFPRGDLQIRYGYAETFDSGAEVRTRAHGPGARWNIRPGWYLNAGYSFRDVRAPAMSSRDRSFNANLLITLR